MSETGPTSAVGRRRKTHRRVLFDFPVDFPERLERFKEESQLSWRSLARLLGVSPYRIREWRRGAVPASAHLFLLLILAERLGLLKTLMCGERDAPYAWEDASCAVSRLRRKLDEDADNPTCVFTEPRVGFRMPKDEGRG